MTPVYTDEQRAALAARATSVALDAGAGCGKTFVLTERFLSHLEPEAEPAAELSEVVAITFTEAAAREMRERIRRRCRERLAEAPETTRAHWRRLLRSLDGARVSTIHAFCGDIVRRHAIPLGLDPGFRVLDPAAAGLMRAEAVDGAIRDALTGAGGRPDGTAVDRAAAIGLNTLKSAVATLADRATDPSFKAWTDRGVDDVLLAWQDFYRRRLAPRYLAQLREAPETDVVRRLLDEARPVTAGFAERITQLREAFAALVDDDVAQSAIQSLPLLLAGRDPVTNKATHTAKDWPDADTKKRYTAACRELRDQIGKQKRPTDLEALRSAAEVGLWIHGVAAAANERYREAKHAAGVLDPDDLLSEARRLLTDERFADERRREAAAIRVLLVDEFQDTDRTQVAIVRALVGEGLSDEGADRGRLFFVGDYKQSIYRFRGAEPGVFRELRGQTPPAGRLPLSKNFRSQPAVLAFVNRLFGAAFADDYTPLQSSRSQDSPTPAVEFLWSPPPAEGGGQRGAAAAERRVEAGAIAARIRELLEAGEPLVGDGGGVRPPRPGDVAVLFRALSDAPIYEEALRAAGLDYYLVGGHAFYAQQEVYDVVNLLRVVDSSCDEIALAGVLRSPIFGLRDETLFWLAKNSGLGPGLFAAVPSSEIDEEERRLVSHARRTITDLRRAKARLSTASLLEDAIQATGYDAALMAEFLGERKRANLDKLVEQARQCDAGGGDLRSFLKQLKEFTRRPPKEALAATSPEEADVVRLMTVHRAKGLEFPIVVLPDLNRPVRAEHASAAYHPELGPLVRPERAAADTAVGLDLYLAEEKHEAAAEQDRLFYVACTRAADRLILSSCLADPGDTDALRGPWLKTLAKRFDLATGAVTGDEAPGEPLVERIPIASSADAGKASESRTDLLRVVEQAERSGAVAPLPSVAPVAVNESDVFEFSVSRLTGRLHGHASGFEVESDASEPLAVGSIFHGAVERVDPKESPSSQRQAAARWARHLALLYAARNPTAAETEAMQLLERFFDSDCWRAMSAAANLHREVEFLLRWPPANDPATSPGALLRGYVDAIHQDADGGHLRIVDYKTDRVSREEVGKTAETYRRQLAVYALAVEQATGVRPATLALHFVRPGVDHLFGWCEADRDHAIEDIDRAIAEAKRLACAPDASAKTAE